MEREEYDILCRIYHKVVQLVYQARNFLATDTVPDDWANLRVDTSKYLATEILRIWQNDMNRPLCVNVFFDNLKGGLNERVLLEQWRLSFEKSSRNHDKISLRSLSKELTVIFRCLYTYLRITPCYKLCRDCKRNQVPSRIQCSLTTSTSMYFKEKVENCSFATLDTPSGRLHLSVTFTQYQSLKELLPQNHQQMIIQDYIPSDDVPSSQNKSKPIGIPGSPGVPRFSLKGPTRPSERESPKYPSAFSPPFGPSGSNMSVSSSSWLSPPKPMSLSPPFSPTTPVSPSSNDEMKLPLTPRKDSTLQEPINFVSISRLSDVSSIIPNSYSSLDSEEVESSLPNIKLPSDDEFAFLSASNLDSSSQLSHFIGLCKDSVPLSVFEAKHRNKVDFLESLKQFQTFQKELT